MLLSPELLLLLLLLSLLLLLLFSGSITGFSVLLTKIVNSSSFLLPFSSSETFKVFVIDSVSNASTFPTTFILTVSPGFNVCSLFLKLLYDNCPNISSSPASVVIFALSTSSILSRLYSNETLCSFCSLFVIVAVKAILSPSFNLSVETFIAFPFSYSPCCSSFKFVE